jgi:hypothetical protein
MTLGYSYSHDISGSPNGSSISTYIGGHSAQARVDSGNPAVSERLAIAGTMVAAKGILSTRAEAIAGADKGRDETVDFSSNNSDEHRHKYNNGQNLA